MTRRTAVTLGLAGLGLMAPAAGQGRQAKIPPEKPAADSLRPSSWILSRTDPRKGRVFEAWLSVPGFPRGDSTDRITLLTPSDARVWFRDAGRQCGDSLPAARTVQAGPLPRDTVLFACVHAAEPGAVRLIAVRRALGPAGVVQNVTVSDAVTATEGPGITPFLPFIMAAVGFLTGILAHMVQRTWDRKLEGRQKTRELEAEVAKALVPETSSNAALLEEFLRSAGSAPPLIVARYVEIGGNHGVLGYLDHDTRRAYLSAIRDLYDRIGVYNDLVHGGAPAEELKAAARGLLPKLKSPLAS